MTKVYSSLLTELAEHEKFLLAEKQKFQLAVQQKIDNLNPQLEELKSSYEKQTAQEIDKIWQETYHKLAQKRDEVLKETEQRLIQLQQSIQNKILEFVDLATQTLLPKNQEET